MALSDKTILDVRNLSTHFFTDEGVVKAVENVSFTLHKGEIMGIVGESGSGKSVTNLSIINLVQSPPGKIVAGEVFYNGEDILKINKKKLREILGAKIAMIFQDPMTSLNPFLRISTQMIETIMLHQKLNRKQARERAIEMLTMAGIPAAQERIDNYPHQFSGGMCQRVMIAMGLSCNPEILIADEPTSALDVTIKAQVLDLIRELKAKVKTAVLFITHDLGVVADMADTVVVMYAGQAVEIAGADDLFEKPSHPYTRALMESIPYIDREADTLFSIDGTVPDAAHYPEGCRFAKRCVDYDKNICSSADIVAMRDVGNGHLARCKRAAGELTAE